MLHPMLTRRQLLGGSVATLAAGVGADAFGVEPRWLEVTEHRVAIGGLPSSLEGYAIAQISDAHLTDLGSVEESIARAVRTADVQLVVLTGDLIDATRHRDVLADLCASLQAPGRQLLATLGNWEHWGRIPVDGLARTYEGVRAQLLVNQHWVSAEGLGVVALDDSTGGAPRPRESIAALPASAATLLVTHSPALLDQLDPSSPRFDLSLAGHTHGGQVTLGPVAPVVPPGSGRFLRGWYDTPVGRAYVSRGTGTSIVPARFMARPELPIFRLARG